MSISVKSSLNGIAAIKKVGIAQPLYDWLLASDVKVKLAAGPMQFEFHHPNLPEMWIVPIKLAQIHQLQHGTLSIKEHEELQGLIEVLIHDLMESGLPLTQLGAPNSALAMLPKGKGEAPPPPKWPFFDITQLHTQTAVHLYGAECMYQPVKGTSASSRYFLVAGIDGLRVAARWRLNSKSLSIRAEGAKLATHKHNVTDSGLAWKGDYASLHLECHTTLIARKALGAVLAGFDVSFETPFPNIHVIAEK